MKLKQSIFFSSLLFSQISCYSLNTNFVMDMDEMGRMPANIGPVGSLSGKVLNKKNVAIFGATITVSEEGRLISTAKTDEFGSYKVKELPSREYSVNASAAGYNSDTYMVRVIQDTDIEYTFILKEQNHQTVDVSYLRSN